MIDEIREKKGFLQFQRDRRDGYRYRQGNVSAKACSRKKGTETDRKVLQFKKKKNVFAKRA